MESKSIKQFLSVVMFICLISYVCLFKLSAIVDAEILANEEIKKINTERIVNTYELLTPTRVIENQLIVFVNIETGLSYSESQFMIDKCRSKDIDLFLLIGLIRKESGFDPNTTGSSGEMGLGQLMERTAKYYSNKLGYEYDKKMIYEPTRNIDLAVEHLAYLKELYNGDVHKMLTAYNRGTKGLENYITDRRSPFEEYSMSSYSVDVLNFSSEYKEKFSKFNDR